MRTEFPNCSLRRSSSDPTVTDRRLENKMSPERVNGLGNSRRADLKDVHHPPSSSAGETGVHLEEPAQPPLQLIGTQHLHRMKQRSKL